MRYSKLLAVLCLLGSCAFGQLPDVSPAPGQKLELDKIRELVAAGALPRNRLVEAEEALADAHDSAILKRTLYGALTVEELTEDQCQEMVEAAQRQYDRQLKVVERSKKLVEVGARPRTAMVADLEELDYRRKTVDLAESRARLLKELAAVAKAETDEEIVVAGTVPVSQRYDGNGAFSEVQLKKIEQSYIRQFGRSLPISANGMTAMHRALGFDHRDRVDVALSPDQAEGRWLRAYLESQRIPYFAFRAAVPGRATAPHIHIGPPSGRLRVAD